jgi:uncharacterized protein (DUF4415 family)
MSRATQYFTDEQLEQFRDFKAADILRYLEEFQKLHSLAGAQRSATGPAPASSKLISIKIPEAMLAEFRRKAESEGVRYQTKIKQLMTEWIEE